MRKTLIALLVAASVVLPTTAGAATQPPPPHGLWVAQEGAHQMTWSWSTVTGATRYRIAISLHPTMTNPRIALVTGRVATFAGLPAGKEYWARVRAIGSSGMSAPSTLVSGRSGAVPRPVGVQPANTQSVTWRWNPYAGAVKYLVQQSSSTTFTSVESHVVTGRRITLPITRTGYLFLRVKPLGSTGRPISDYWSFPANVFGKYHPAL